MEERKALIMKKEEGGDTMMDLWRTGRDRLKERVELLGSHFKELRGLFFLASCGAISYFFSAAVSEEITEMESQRGALYGSNRDQTTGLTRSIMQFTASHSPSLCFHHLHKFGNRFWMGIIFITQSAACLSST